MINFILNFIRRRPKVSLILIGFGLLFILGVILNEVLVPNPNNSNYQNPSPISSNPTATSSADIPSRYPAPASVSWTNLTEKPTLDKILPLYKFTFNPLSKSNLTKLSAQLGFSDNPSEVKTKYIDIIGWANNSFHLDADRNESSINFGYNEISPLTTTGEFSPTEQLLQQTVSLLKTSSLFDSRIEFSLGTITYSKPSTEWLTIANSEEASFITLTIDPQIGKYPLYMQGKSFIEATYNRQNKLIKLVILSPISQISPAGQVNLYSFEQLIQIPSSEYFRLYVKPKTQYEYQHDSSDIPALYPTSIITGYYLSNQKLSPIHIVKNNDNYLYATFAEEKS